MNRIKTIIVITVILLSLAGFYSMYRFLYKKMAGDRSLSRLLLFMFLILVLVFAYTFLVVFIIRLLIPGA